MQSKAASVEQYLAELPSDRRKSIETLRKTIRKHLPKGYDEGMQYGMIGYFVPHKIYPPGYHCDAKQPLPFAHLASQKNHIGIYMMCLYSDQKRGARFVQAWKATGKRLDMGKSCIRVKSSDDVPLDVLGKAIAEVSVADYIANYESIIRPLGGERAAPKVKSTDATTVVKDESAAPARGKHRKVKPSASTKARVKSAANAKAKAKSAANAKAKSAVKPKPSKAKSVGKSKAKPGKPKSARSANSKPRNSTSVGTASAKPAAKAKRVR